MKGKTLYFVGSPMYINIRRKKNIGWNIKQLKSNILVQTNSLNVKCKMFESYLPAKLSLTPWK